MIFFFPSLIGSLFLLAIKNQPPVLLFLFYHSLLTFTDFFSEARFAWAFLSLSIIRIISVFYNRDLLCFLPDLNTIKTKYHIGCSLKISLTFQPAHSALAMLQSDKLLFHFPAAFGAYSISHISLHKSQIPKHFCKILQVIRSFDRVMIEGHKILEFSSGLCCPGLSEFQFCSAVTVVTVIALASTRTILPDFIITIKSG